MTEQEWLKCTDPTPMLGFLRDKSSNRKLRLFACACCRRIWPLLGDERSKRAVQVAEEYADNLVDNAARRVVEEYSEVVRSAAQALYDSEVNESTYAESDEIIADGWILLMRADAAAAAKATVLAQADSAALQTAIAASTAEEWNVQAGRYRLGEGRERQNEKMDFREKPKQAGLARCIFGPLPFRAVVVDGPWLAWNDGTVVKIAQNIYEERAFDRLPILADALTDAGCDHADLLNHCRREGPHVKGCWVVDLVLGKE